MGRLYSSTFYALRDTKTPLRFAIVRVALTTVLGYLFALVFPKLLGIDPKLGAAGLTASAGIAGWVEFFLLRREMDKRIGRTRLVPSRRPDSGDRRCVGAAIPWAYKLIVDRGSTLFSAHENAVHSQDYALILLGIYGLAYVGFTAAFGIPEARNVVDRVGDCCGSRCADDERGGTLVV